MEQEEKEIQPKDQFDIHFAAEYKEIHSTADFQLGLQQEHLHRKRFKKESSQCAMLQNHKMLIIEQVTWKIRAT